jgi:hypothetical protein
LKGDEAVLTVYLKIKTATRRRNLHIATGETIAWADLDICCGIVVRCHHHWLLLFAQLQ